LSAEVKVVVRSRVALERYANVGDHVSIGRVARLVVAEDHTKQPFVRRWMGQEYIRQRRLESLSSHGADTSHASRKRAQHGFDRLAVVEDN
jgi:hypothetical protein